MPRFITVTLQCDWDGCSTLGEEGSGEVVEKTVALGSTTLGATKTFLVCAKHDQEIDEMLLPLMAKGVKAEKPKRSRTTTPSPSETPAETIECKACGRTDIKNRAGLAQHVIRSHDFASVADYEAKYHVHIE